MIKFSVSTGFFLKDLLQVFVYLNSTAMEITHDLDEKIDFILIFKNYRFFFENASNLFLILYQQEIIQKLSSKKQLEVLKNLIFILN